MAAESQPTQRRSSRRPRWRSRLELGLLGTVLTFVGLIVGSGGRLPQIELFPHVEGISEADVRLLDEIKKLGGQANFMERTPRFLGLVGGRDLLHFSFHGKALDDEALARIVKSYGDRMWGLDLSNTGLTDASLRHLGSLPHIHDLSLGNVDPRLDPHGPNLPQNQFTDAGLVHLKGLTSLQGLHLGGLPVTDAGLETIKDLPNLGGLYLDRTRVSGPGLGRLKSLPGLAVLYFDGSNVTDEGLAHLKGATNLQFLSLVKVPLTGRGLTPLKALPKLNRLDVKGCGLSFEDLDDFQVACPSVKLE
jgi:hypothetical protein